MLGTDEEAQEAVDRALAAGVKNIITIGIDIKSSKRAVQFAQAHDNVYAAVGIHPHHAEEFTPEAGTTLRELAHRKRVIAYGEIGIDTVKNYAPLDTQEKAFQGQLQLAKELELPVIIHDREAHEHIYRLLCECGPFPSGGIIHCFSGDAAVARKFIDLGFFISIPGVVTFNKADTLQDAVRSIPLSRLLVETDAPFLAPVPRRGKKNEPCYTLYTAQKVAELKGVDINEVAM
ncbi:MAG: TatD family hydrolase, partial [Desulfobulbaceae bacterium]|nr:TatD family hydrolase [Desulfobulbaceae bacterium]